MIQLPVSMCHQKSGSPTRRQMTMRIATSAAPTTSPPSVGRGSRVRARGGSEGGECSGATATGWHDDTSESPLMLAKGWRGTIHWGSPGTGTEQGWPQRPPGRRTAVAVAAGGRLQAAASRPPGYRLRSRVWLIGPLALYGLLRIPSFLQPHWYTDQAGYVTTAP